MCNEFFHDVTQRFPTEMHTFHDDTYPIPFLYSVITLVDVKKANVTRAYMGSLMTSLEMAGVSITLIKFTSNWADLLGVLVISEVVVYVTCSIIR